MMLAFVHVLQPIDPCAGTRGKTICVLNASRSKHHHNSRRIIGLRPTNQRVDLALIAAVCITFPTAQPPLPNLRCSGLEVVPKKDRGWRVISHLSAPEGRSINDFINPTHYSLHYSLHYRTIDSAIYIINVLGHNALMGKFDLRCAFRQVPVRREDWHLLGIQWQGRWYVDKCLPFGLRSSPALFNQLATVIEWILHHNYKLTHIIHYLDDFFTAGQPNSNECTSNMEIMNTLCHQSGSPTKPEKEKGPTTAITFLGIFLDSRSMTASITREKDRAGAGNGPHPWQAKL